MKPALIPVAAVVVGERYRKDYGDVTELAESIREVGLIQPIVIDENRNLIAGGRRFAAMTTILKWTEVPCVLAETQNSELKLRRMELEENVKRKEMSWKERVVAIANIHRLYQEQAIAESGDIWSMKATGKLLGISVGNVQYCVVLAKMLADPNHPVQKAESLTDALKVLIQLKEDAAKREEAEIIGQVTGVIPTHLASDVRTPLPEAVQKNVKLSLDAIAEGKPADSLQEKLTLPVSTMFHHKNCIDFMSSLSEPEFDHIITDPPYAIDMSNLAQQNTGMSDISRIEATHDVKQNLELFTLMWPLFYKSLRPGGYCIVWIDQMLWQTHYDLAVSAGFKVQRWPLVWVKTHRCMNQAAQFNFTKATEIAIVCRKGESTLVAPQPVNYWIGGNDASKDSHPFAKPASLWQWCANAVAIKGQKVFDPFMGVGSCPSALAAIGLNPHGCEVDKDHYSRALVNFRDVMQAKFPNFKLEFI